MAENVVRSPWVHLDPLYARTQEVLREALSRMPRELRPYLSPAYILLLETSSGKRPTVVWHGGQDHKSFPYGISAFVVYSQKKQGSLL